MATTIDKDHPAWQVYILRCADDSLYTGIARDLERRIAEHNADNGLGASYTRSRRPVMLVYAEPAADRSSASKREYEIKQLSREQKLLLIAASGATQTRHQQQRGGAPAQRRRPGQGFQ